MEQVALNHLSAMKEMTQSFGNTEGTNPQSFFNGFYGAKAVGHRADSTNPAMNFRSGEIGFSHNQGFNKTLSFLRIKMGCSLFEIYIKAAMSFYFGNIIRTPHLFDL